jgi:ethanolamine utilization protein EutN
MRTGIVIGTVVATRKEESLVGCKLLLTQPVTIDKKPVGEPILAVDTVGAGIGEWVIFATGTASRNAANRPKAAIDAAIIGIIDQVDVDMTIFDERPQGEGIKK